MRSRIFFIFLFILMYSCSVAQNGKIRLLSDIEGLSIYINGVKQGNVPVTIELQPGEYTVIGRKDISGSECYFAEEKINIAESSFRLLTLAPEIVKIKDLPSEKEKTDFDGFLSTLQSYVKDAGNKIARSCSLFGGATPSSIDWSADNITVDKIVNTIKIPLTVHWYGSITGFHYWLSGNLMIYLNTNTQHWITSGSSPGLSSGCCDYCIN